MCIAYIYYRLSFPEKNRISFSCLINLGIFVSRYVGVYVSKCSAGKE